MTITQPGTVVDGIDLRGSIKIKASNVTVRRSRIRGAYGVGTGDHTPYSNILIEDVELDGYDPAVYLDDGVVHSSDQLRLSGIHGDGINVRRPYIHGFGPLVRSANHS